MAGYIACCVCLALGHDKARHMARGADTPQTPRPRGDRVSPGSSCFSDPGELRCAVGGLGRAPRRTVPAPTIPPRGLFLTAAPRCQYPDTMPQAIWGAIWRYSARRTTSLISKSPMARSDIDATLGPHTAGLYVATSRALPRCAYWPVYGNSTTGRTHIDRHMAGPPMSNMGR